MATGLHNGARRRGGQLGSGLRRRGAGAGADPGSATSGAPCTAAAHRCSSELPGAGRSYPTGSAKSAHSRGAPPQPWRQPRRQRSPPEAHLGAHPRLGGSGLDRPRGRVPSSSAVRAGRAGLPPGTTARGFPNKLGASARGIRPPGRAQQGPQLEALQAHLADAALEEPCPKPQSRRARETPRKIPQPGMADPHPRGQRGRLRGQTATAPQNFRGGGVGAARAPRGEGRPQGRGLHRQASTLLCCSSAWQRRDPPRAPRPRAPPPVLHAPPASRGTGLHPPTPTRFRRGALREQRAERAARCRRRSGRRHQRAPEDSLGRRGGHGPLGLRGATARRRRCARRDRRRSTAGGLDSARQGRRPRQRDRGWRHFPQRRRTHVGPAARGGF